ncbi:molybdenum ABC transporter periplasmic molybdate-binding protein [Nitritalea halalkaliphila LW7]|uniref:Molybdenum ABC transporter periplasmic molybdate-binding protein n=1 Tax=Nitritalea halalkaliphila LW7 TaxID=1189621 RepID=I5BWZ9_9BACT|nr:molybdate ABC transporter substrate-binding protein [Nitritalea halalkaliphila]EIM74101.1 molybdenum ABC transporter periplasmic molybdate-binding protein [Nitritalea halalkaliphila LW7]
MLKHRLRYSLLLSALFLLSCGSGSRENEAQETDETASSKGILRIAAAADLRYALDSIVSRYSDPAAIEVIYGSSGKLYEQLSRGAPFHLYFSADIQYPERLVKAGKAGSAVYPYGLGRLVLWQRQGKREQLADLQAPEVRKIAIANPRHAPYGLAAEQALRSSGLYEALRDKLIFGENIAQTAQFVSTGGVEAGIIALALMRGKALHALNPAYTLLPEELHAPLLQALS